MSKSMTKTHGKKRWHAGPKDNISRLMGAEIHADSLHNSIRYYLKHPEHFQIEKLEEWEITASKTLGYLRKVLGEMEWFDQLSLKRWINPAPNQPPLKEV